MSQIIADGAIERCKGYEDIVRLLHGLDMIPHESLGYALANDQPILASALEDGSMNMASLSRIITAMYETREAGTGEQ